MGLGVCQRQFRQFGSVLGTRPSTPQSPRTPLKPLTPSSTKGQETGAADHDKSDIQKILKKLDKLDKIEESMTVQETAVTQITDKLGQMNTKCEDNERDCKQVREETAGVKIQVKVHGMRLTEVEHKVELLKRERRRNILIIDGIAEKEGEKVKEVVGKAFEDLQVQFGTGICSAIFRRGKPPKEVKAHTRPRQIVVIFHRQHGKGEIFRNLSKLKGVEAWEKVYFNDDLTEIQAGEQRDLRALAAFARDIGQESKVKAGQLHLGGRRYRYDELFKLPGEITLLQAKNRHILEDSAIVFQSPYSPLSNLSRATSFSEGNASNWQRGPGNTLELRHVDTRGKHN